MNIIRPLFCLFFSILFLFSCQQPKNNLSQESKKHQKLLQQSLSDALIFANGYRNAVTNTMSFRARPEEALRKILQLGDDTKKLIGLIDIITNNLSEKAPLVKSSGKFSRKEISKQEVEKIIKSDIESLASQLTQYTTKLNKDYKDADPDKLKQLGEGSDDESFYESRFNDITTEGVFTMLLQIQVDILRQEHKILKAFAIKYKVFD